jgi:3-mercaptopyruvate sulfurtransferase SseA
MAGGFGAWKKAGAPFDAAEPRDPASKATA